MKILDPERNSTSNLWKRLESGADTPIVCMTTVLVAMPLINDEDKTVKYVVVGVLLLMLVLTFLNSYLQKKAVKELKGRYEKQK
jgi:intracellular septation protein A